VLGGAAIGRSRAEIDAARDALRAMLKSGATPPAPPFEDLEVLVPARDFANRHASILLAFEATADALAEAERAA
jgi:NifU-like protein involved in Fe-S cluster formation